MLQNLAKAHLAATVAAILVSATAHAGLSSRSYVQRGLAVQYDGINNVDHGDFHAFRLYARAGGGRNVLRKSGNQVAARRRRQQSSEDDAGRGAVEVDMDRQRTERRP